MVRGSCLCGDVAWQVDADLQGMSHCHCSMCRKAHGSAFVTWAIAPAAAFSWVRGEDVPEAYESSPDFYRPFCPRCGTAVPASPHGELAFMPAGALDQAENPGRFAHIYTASQAPWYEIVDEHPRFPVMPPGFEGPRLGSRKLDDATAPDAVRGSCLCGAVAYEVDGPSELIVCCHCSRCRKSRSAAHATNMFRDSADVRVLRGAGSLRSYKVPDAERFTATFCSICGSLMPRADAAPGPMVIPAGSLDDDPGARPRFHIFTASKAPWYDIPGKLPQFPERAGVR